MKHKKIEKIAPILIITLIYSTILFAANYQLTSGVPYSGTIDALSYYGPGNQFYITVPAGATQLQIDLLGNPNTYDIDLYAKFNADCNPIYPYYIYDYWSEGAQGIESITVNASSSPPLQAGNYYISIVNYDESDAVNYTITATVTSGDKIEDFFKYTVGSQATSTIILDPASTTADLDLFLFKNTTDATFNESTDVIASARSSTAGATETITQTLQAGTYFVGVSAYDGGSNSSAYNLTIVHGTGGGQVFTTDTFDSSTEGWIFTSIMGSSTKSNPAGYLKITYNNTTAFSYWRRPYTTGDVVKLEPNKLYRAAIRVTSSNTSTTTGSYPDFRIYAGAVSGPGSLFFVNSFLSNGGTNYISPKTSGTNYSYYFEPTGLSSTPPVDPYSNLVLQFEGFNFPFSGRPNLIGTSIGLDRIEIDKFTTFDANASGTAIRSMTSSASFAIGSGTPYGWVFSSPSAPNHARATGGLAPDNQGLRITANPLGTNSWAYGVFDANPVFASSEPTFSGGALYRATFNITTNVTASGTVNAPIAQVRLQTGDNHVTVFANVASTFPGNKIIGPSESSNNYIDLWFFYPTTRTAGSFNENKLFPSFELLVLAEMGIPNSSNITLRDFWLTKHTRPTNP